MPQITSVENKSVIWKNFRFKRNFLSFRWENCTFGAEKYCAKNVDLGEKVTNIMYAGRKTRTVFIEQLATIISAGFG